MPIGCVVPSCREEQAILFVENWAAQCRARDVRIYLVEDGPAPSFALPSDATANLQHLCWRNAPTGMLDCIAVRSPGCRQIGCWRAFQDGCAIIVTLDDDVRPLPGTDLFGEFAEVLTEGVPVWVDPLQNYPSRGFPARNPGKLPVAFHVGSFFGIPDVDGDTQLRCEAEFARRPPEYLRRPMVVPQGQLIPVNGGICGWRRELTPYVHWTLWDKDLAYCRYDDIWMGVLLKRVLDLSGLSLSYGPPGARHMRASDARSNAVLERNGKEWNERFWELLDRALDSRRATVRLSMDEAWTAVIAALDTLENSWATREAAAMRAWRRFF